MRVFGAGVRKLGRVALLAGLAGSVGMLWTGVAEAQPVPSPSCVTPSLTVIPASGPEGSAVVVSGTHFSGCPAQGSSTPPTGVLPVKVGVGSKTGVTKVLASTQTNASGSFSVTVTIPALSTGGIPALEIVAASKDPATGLAYLAFRPFSVTGSTPPSVPVAVNTGASPGAGSGGPIGPLGVEMMVGAGLVLCVGGGIALRRANR